MLETESMTLNFVLRLLFFISFPCFLQAASTDYPSVRLPTYWINNDSFPRGSSHFVDGSIVRPVLLNNNNTLDFPAIGCGFYGNQTRDSFFFAVFAVQAKGDSTFITENSPEILWTANRANPVRENATLQLTSDGDLVLRDGDGTLVWSSNTSNMSVAQMTITGNGTFKLVNSMDLIVWQSWAHPTDTWLPGQTLVPGQRLIASVSSSNWNPGQFFLSFVDEDLFAFIESDPPQMYRKIFNKDGKSKQFKTGSLDIHNTRIHPTKVLYVSKTERFQYMRLDSDGHLRVYQWNQGVAVAADDILTDNLGDCAYPTVCGNYGICSNGQCSCPVGNDGGASYFKKLNSSHGCIEVTHLSYQSSHPHLLLELDDVSYFGFTTVLANIDVESCKQACLKNCSCKAALFRYTINLSTGNCSLPSRIFSLMSSPRGVVPYHSLSFIKVQKPIPSVTVTSNKLVTVTSIPLVSLTTIQSVAPNTSPTKSSNGSITVNASPPVTLSPVPSVAPTPYPPVALTPNPSVAPNQNPSIPSSESSTRRWIVIILITVVFPFLIISFLIFCIKIVSKLANFFKGCIVSLSNFCIQIFSKFPNFFEGCKVSISNFCIQIFSKFPNFFKGCKVSLSNFCIQIFSKFPNFFKGCKVSLSNFCIQIRKRKNLVVEGRENNADEDWENSLDLLSNLPTRFTYKDLESATMNFHKKLGGGGFGSVFEGTLGNGTKIAVKRLDRLGQGRKEFLAEVKTIGSIHHVNLVRLIGFCAENSHRLLVYEYMSNGSLDKWIFPRTPETTLEWEIREKIILKIAKGLAYLHEDCRMRIAHFDIKPQNILLDDRFNAKLSDFGLARLIDENQSQVITQMRGTRGYMAPEWLSRKITEKVDVYSFGVVMLEIVCGRKNLDFSLTEEDDHLLLHMVKKKAEENRLFDLVDKCSEDMQQHGEEAVKMIMVAIWCLHFDFTRRPSMSMVVKVLEGVMVMEPISDYSFLTSTMVEAPVEVVIVASTPQSASILSGPR